MQTVSITITKKVTILLYIVTGQIFKAIFLGGKKSQKSPGIKIPSPSLDTGIPDPVKSYYWLTLQLAS